MFLIRRQMIALLSVSALASFELGGASWVVLLAARGFSMVEIGLAEGVFHVASLLFEIPSGVISDVFGRRNSMVLSCVMRILSAVLMAFSQGLAGVCLSLVFAAFSYNFASGAREALAYDSLKSVGQEAHYLKYSSLEMTLYRIGSASATLLAGVALWLGNTRARLLDAALGLVCLAVTCILREAAPQERAEQNGAAERIAVCVKETYSFLTREKRALRIMLMNAFAGAISILLTFFLQAQLPLAGLHNAYLGPALFVMGLGGAAGSRLALRTQKVSYGRLYALCLGGVLAGLALGVSGRPAAMVLGGFAAGMLDDLLQVRTDSLLQDQFPSSQRATLVSVSSLCFSLVMIGMSPLAGLFFECL